MDFKITFLGTGGGTLCQNPDTDAYVLMRPVPLSRLESAEAFGAMLEEVLSQVENWQQILAGMREAETAEGDASKTALPRPTMPPIGAFEETGDGISLKKEEAVPRRLKNADTKKILIVDDTEMNVDLLSRMVRAAGLAADTAANGREALALVQKKRYDLIFMDHMMPVMDGIEALHVMRSSHLCDGTPVIMLTANAVEGEKEKYLSEGFDAYLTKPFSEATIRSVLMKFLKLEEEQTIAFDNRAWEMFAELLPYCDVDSAKRYHLGDADFYAETLRAYLENDFAGELEKSTKKRYFSQYKSLLRSLADVSRLIGAKALAERTEKVYRAADTENYLKFREISSSAAGAQNADLLSSLLTDIRTFTAALENALHTIEAAMADTTGAGYSAYRDTRPLILVVDDEENIRVMAERMLGSLYRVEVCAGGEEAIAIAKSKLPSLVLLDVRMPQPDGFEILHGLKADADTTDIPVVFITSDESRETEIRGFQEGAADFIRKPFVAEVLLQRIRRLIELSHLQRYLRREVALQSEKVGLLTQEVMLALSKAADAKDHYTNGHSQRVAAYSSEIAKRLGKTKKEQEDIYAMGLLHDVGKIGVHEAIINKPGKLNSEEFEEIENHTTIGYEILKTITGMPDLASGARWHHERYDGRGYPDGLKGEEIPLEARIICVADSYDAMTSKRSYSTVKTQAQVRAELVENKGKQFDPAIADIMIAMIDEDTEYKMSERDAIGGGGDDKRR